MLNRGLLPKGYYALAEQIAGGLGPDVLALEGPTRQDALDDGLEEGGVALATVPPKVQFHVRTEVDQYAAKANAVIIRHASNHAVIWIVEIVSPGNKNSRHGLRAFVDKTEEVIRAGVHLLIVDLFPSGSFDPEGIHAAIWDRFDQSQFRSLRINLSRWPPILGERVRRHSLSPREWDYRSQICRCF